MDDGRKHQRCNVHWRSAVSIVGRSGPQTLQCKTNDVSLGGVSVICPLNLAPGSELTIYLLIDPGGPTHPQVIFEAHGKVMNTVLSGQQGGFRVGIQFTKFAGDSKQILSKNLPKEIVKPERLATTGAMPAPPAAPPPAEASAETPTEAPGAAPDAPTEATEAGAAADSAQGEAAPAATGESETPPEGAAPAQP